MDVAQPISADGIAAEAAELEYQCLLGERAHFDAGWQAWRMWRTLGLVGALLTAATTGSALEVVGLLPGLEGKARTALTGMFALLLALTAAALGFLDPKGVRDKHDQIGKRLAALRAEARLLRRVPLPKEGDLRELLRRHAEVMAEAPPIGDARHNTVKNQLASNVHYRNLRSLTGRSVTTSK